MTPSRLRRCTAWLLPFLVARLLVPTGFMLSLSDAGLDIVLCTGLAPSSAPLVAQEEHDRHAGIDHAAHAMQRDTQTQIPAPSPDHPSHANPICPFALAGGAVVAPVCKGVDEPRRLVALLPGSRADPAWIAPAVLIDRIRGPPLA